MNPKSSTSETTKKPKNDRSGELEQLQILKAREKTMPLNDPSVSRHVRIMGDIRDEDLRVFIPKALLKKIVDYSNSVTSREIGGLLIGNVWRDGEIGFIEIERFIRAQHAEEMSASLKFTHDTWSSVTREWDAMKEEDDNLEESIMVGWHHTHPRFGIFLSSHDRFIHEGYFDLPYQIALVVDPVAERFGFFQWSRRPEHKGKRTLIDCGFYSVE